jgi:hypothetical protein
MEVICHVERGGTSGFPQLRDEKGTSVGETVVEDGFILPLEKGTSVGETTHLR